MALKQISPPPKEDEGKVKCPKCGEEALIIEGKYVRWITCPSCKFKTLVEKKDRGIKITPLK